MCETTENQLLILQQKELDLKVQQLEITVNQAKQPEYKKLSFWISTTTVLLALGGIFGQNLVSNFKAESAKLETLKTEQRNGVLDRKAKQTAIRLTKAKQLEQQYTKKVIVMKAEDARLRQSIGQTTRSFGDLMKILAYGPFFNSLSKEEQTRILNASAEVSRLSESKVILLQNSILKVYCAEGLQAKAKQINQLLLSKGASSAWSTSPYPISDVKNNRLVYYNQPQKAYCEAMRILLKNAGYGDFKIMQSSGANETTRFFKIYLVN